MRLIIEKEQEIKEIIEALENCYFDNSSDYTFEDDIVTPFQVKYKKQFNHASGATKGVLIFKDLGFVIKIPFIYCDEEEMRGAGEGVRGWDYCSQEAARYEQARKDGLEDIFLETAFLTEVNNHPIYIQPYANILSSLSEDKYNNDHRSSTHQDRNIICNINETESYWHINSNWEADLYVQYGIEKFKKFKEYITNNLIEDLRDDNIGYVGKFPVLTDYAGFNS